MRWSKRGEGGEPYFFSVERKGGDMEGKKSVLPQKEGRKVVKIDFHPHRGTRRVEWKRKRKRGLYLAFTGKRKKGEEGKK